MAYTDDLRTTIFADSIMSEVASATEGAARNIYIAALLNSPSVTETENPSAQGQVIKIPDEIKRVTDLMGPEETAKALTTMIADVLAEAAPLVPIPVDLLLSFRDEEGEPIDLDLRTAVASSRIVKSKNIAAILSLIEVLEAVGFLEEKTATVIRDAMYIDDPEWSPTLIALGKSRAEWLLHRPSVSPADVAEALA